MRRNPKEYIAHLQYQSRMKKEQDKRDRSQPQRQREEGFNVYLRGANEERVAAQKTREQSQDRARPRKKWSPPTLRNDNSSEEYSDAFEEESEGEVAETLESLQELVTDDKKALIISKLDSLDPGQLEKVLHFVEELAREERTSLPSFMKEKPKAVIHKHKRPFSRKGNEDTNSKDIIIKVLSTWGHAHLVGITEIEVFSKNAEKVAVKPANVSLKNTGGGSLSNPAKMFDEVTFTEDEKHMWLGPLPVPPECLEIVISQLEDLGGLRIWNYNKSLLDSVKGVREIEIWKDGQIAWTGTVSRGSGNKEDTNFTDIPLMANFAFPSLNPKPEETALPKQPEIKPPWVKQVPSEVFSPVHVFKASSREKKRVTSEAKLIPEPTMRLLELNAKREPLKESLDSLEFFKITNNSRIKREPVREKQEERKTLPRIPEPDPLDFLVAENEAKPFVMKDTKVPYFPKGQVLSINILSTWGDHHYVGLSGIEIFDQIGKPLKFREPFRHISANPPDVNILPGYGTDPRTVDKLLDGTHLTCDDLHVWLAPFTEGQKHEVRIDFLSQTSISMMRIWNYNKSRIHSYRGARQVEITLDGGVIFKGEIQQAPGNLKDADQCCEYILFTKDESILRKIDENDWVKHFEVADEELASTIRPNIRPGTGTREEDLKEMQSDRRPMTSAIIAPMPSSKSKSQAVLGRKIRVSILDTWGDAFYVGLTGIAVLTRSGLLPINKHWVDANPRDMNVIPGHSGDYRTVDKLVNGKNVTTNDHNMWLIPFCYGKLHYIDFDLQENRHITGLVFWNYNKNFEDTDRGARNIAVYVDGQCLANSTLRKAPGHADIDFGQLINLPSNDTWTEDSLNRIYASELVGQDYETPFLPQGFVLKLRLLNTWGDMHYIGLNGIEVYNEKGQYLLTDRGFAVSARPPSLRELPGMQHDVRTPDKLVDGINMTNDDRHMWLAPYVHPSVWRTNGPNEVAITFESVVKIGFIKLCNYGKTWDRGVKEFEISLDDVLIYKGVMRKASAQGDYSTVVLFTGDRAVVGRHAEQVYKNSSLKSSVLLYNEHMLVAGMEEKKPYIERPYTGVVVS